MSHQEEAALFESLNNNDLVKQVVTVALHTGMRRGEIFNLKWFDVDLNRGFLLIRESKSGKKRMVPMNLTVKTLMAGLQRSSELVFPSPKTGERLNDIKKSFS